MIHGINQDTAFDQNSTIQGRLSSGSFNQLLLGIKQTTGLTFANLSKIMWLVTIKRADGSSSVLVNARLLDLVIYTNLLGGFSGAGVDNGDFNVLLNVGRETLFPGDELVSQVIAQDCGAITAGKLHIAALNTLNMDMPLRAYESFMSKGDFDVKRALELYLMSTPAGDTYRINAGAGEMAIYDRFAEILLNASCKVEADNNYAQLWCDADMSGEDISVRTPADKYLFYIRYV